MNLEYQILKGMKEINIAKLIIMMLTLIVILMISSKYNKVKMRSTTAQYNGAIQLCNELTNGALQLRNSNS